MDPDTTLITFMLETTFRISSLHLIGSWDNFSKRYPMERDARRGQDQWRGCFALDNAVCLEHAGAHHGGLRMGCTYYYFYEMDEDIEIFDPMKPVTSSCPSLPGQPVNVLDVPMSAARPRSRCASLQCLTPGEFMTTDPRSKYRTPRPPITPYDPRTLYLNTSWGSRDQAASPITPSHLKRLWSTMLPYDSLGEVDLSMPAPDTYASDNTTLNASRECTRDGNAAARPRTLVAPWLQTSNMPATTDVDPDSAQSPSGFVLDDVFDHFDEMTWPLDSPLTVSSLGGSPSAGRLDSPTLENPSFHETLDGSLEAGVVRGDAMRLAPDRGTATSMDTMLKGVAEAPPSHRSNALTCAELEHGASTQSVQTSSNYDLWSQAANAASAHHLEPRLEHRSASDTAVSDLQALLQDMSYLGHVISGQ